MAVVCLWIGAATAQDPVQSKLVNGSTFMGTATDQSNRTRAVRVSFRVEGGSLLAQYGSTGYVPARIDGNTVSFKFNYNGQQHEASLALADDGMLKGALVGPRRSGPGTYRESLTLKGQAP